MVAAFVTSMVIVAGASATSFLVANGATFRAAAAAALTAVFAATIVALVPRSATTLHRDGSAVLHLRQSSVFPAVSWSVSDPAGANLGTLRRPFAPRLVRDLWLVERGDAVIGEARWSSRFSRRRTLRLTSGGLDCAVVRKRERTLEITSSVLDAQICLALAVVIFGGER